ncbi:unnamed protein product, partial [Urochloa humidicola]
PQPPTLSSPLPLTRRPTLHRLPQRRSRLPHLAATPPPSSLPPTTAPLSACSCLLPNPPTIHRGGGREGKARSRSMAAAAPLNYSISMRPSDLPSPVPSLKSLTELAASQVSSSAAEFSRIAAAMEDKEHEVYNQDIPVDGKDVDMFVAGDDAAKVPLCAPSPPLSAPPPPPRHPNPNGGTDPWR